MTDLKLLFDTNAFIACEDISRVHLHANAEVATRLRELAEANGCDLFLHRATRDDLDRSKNRALVTASRLKMRQWKILDDPYARNGLAEQAGYTPPLSANDSVDLQMLTTLDANAVDLLITEDKALRKHATKAGFAERVLSLQGGVEYLERLFSEPVQLPTVERRVAHTLNRDDPTFDTLREDYADFDSWFAKACLEHRECLVIIGHGGAIEAVAILKVETDGPWGLRGKVLKVCTFKVAAAAGGAKRGELVLKAVFMYAEEKDADYIYVEAFAEHEGILRLFDLYGFHRQDTETQRGELILVKNRRAPDNTDGWDPLDYHRDFGPPAVLVRDAFVVPIKPKWHDVLFPELRIEDQLFGPDPSGNAIMKAYLSLASTTMLRRGSLLLFYRSEDLQAVTVVGVVDTVRRLTDPVEVRRFVSLRTVYSDADIRSLCENSRGVLAILFRHDRSLPEPWSRQLLEEVGVINGPPQSIQHVESEGGLSWLKSALSAPH